MTSRRTRALAALGLASALAAGSGAGTLPPGFEDARASVRADLGRERLWDALEKSDALAARAGLTAAQRAWALRESARLRVRAGDASGAEKNLRDALQASPEDPEIFFALARVLRESDPEEALRLADEAGANELAGELRLELGDAAGARASLAKALKKGDDLDALAAMARAQEGKAAAAEYAARLRRAAEREPAWARGAALRLSGRVWLELGDAERAAEAFAAALGRDPDDLEALRALARLKREQPGLALKLPAAAVEPAGAPAASLDAADLFVEALCDAPAWRRPEGYLAIARTLAAMGPAAKERAYAAASRADALDGPRVGVALVYRLAAGSPRAPDEPGSVEFAALAYRAVVAARRELGDREGARSTLARALRALPDSVELRLDQARLALEDGRPAEAIKDLRTLPPGGTPAARLSRAEAQLLRARAEHALKDDAAAERSVDAAVAETPVERDGLARAAALEAELGLSTAAYARLDRLRAVSASPFERAEAEERRAEVQLVFKDKAGAEASLRRALKDAPDDPGMLGRLVDLEADRGAPEALADADRLLKLSEASGDAARASARERKTRVERALADAGKSRGRVLSRSGDRDGAAAAFEAALALVPDDREALGELAGLELARGRGEKASAYAERLVAASRDSGAAALSDAYERQAQVLQALGDEAGAAAALAKERALEPRLREEMKASLEKKPGDWPALKRLVDLELGRGSAREALALVERHPAAPEFAAPWLVWRGAARSALGDEARAREDFSAAAKRDAAAACLGDELPARREALPAGYFDACLERLPAEPRLYVDRGMARFGAGRQAAAAEDFRRAVELQPGSAEAQLSLISALEALGRADEAAVMADVALKAVDPSAPLYGRLVEVRGELRMKSPMH